MNARDKTSDDQVDAFIFPGNSGGPVVTRPQVVSIEGTKSLHFAHLIGIVGGYVPYIDAAISPQTGMPRVIFEENSGLAAVVPMDFVMEAIEPHEKDARVRDAQEKASDNFTSAH